MPSISTSWIDSAGENQPRPVAAERAANSIDTIAADNVTRVSWREAERLLGSEVCRRLGLVRLPDDFRLSVVIPCYNEAHTILKVIDRVREAGLPTEIIIVDDGSTDGTRDVLRGLAPAADLRVVFHDENQGKGAALRTGFVHATGDVITVQDADLEYDPRDFWQLLQPIVEDVADVVYGTRFNGTDRHVGPLWHLAVNRFISRLFSLRHGYRFSDVETCYKLFRRELIQEIAPELRERRFGIELELTAKLLRKRTVRFYERPISYARRTFAQGKKITWRDGVAALWCILKY